MKRSPTGFSCASKLLARDCGARCAASAHALAGTTTRKDRSAGCALRRSNCCSGAITRSHGRGPRTFIASARWTRCSTRSRRFRRSPKIRSIGATSSIARRRRCGAHTRTSISCVRAACLTTTAGRRGSAPWPDASTTSARAAARAGSTRRPCRARRPARPATCWSMASSDSAATPTPMSPRCCTKSWRRASSSSRSGRRALVHSTFSTS